MKSLQCELRGGPADINRHRGDNTQANLKGKKEVRISQWGPGRELQGCTKLNSEEVRSRGAGGGEDI